MIDFLKPNKSKLKLSIFILMLFVIFYLFQAGLHGYLKEHASGEYVKLMTKPKYSEMKQSFEKLAEAKPVNGSDISFLHFKYVILNIAVSFVFTAFLSYLGACFIYSKWNLLGS
jgi:ABC-type multidrug transport system fused ATPase/permease subunit